MQRTQEVINFTPHPGQVAVLNSKKRFVFALAGQRGGKCCAPETIISGQRLDSFGFAKGTDQFWDLDGRLLATSEHRVLTEKGWSSVNELLQSPLEERSAYFVCPSLTNGDISLSDFYEGDLSSWKTIQDFQSDYLAYFRSNGGRPQSLGDIDQDGSPLPIGALAGKFSNQYESEHNHLYQSFDHLSNKDGLHPLCHQFLILDPDSSLFDQSNYLILREFSLSDLPKELTDRVLQNIPNSLLSSSYVSLILFPKYSIYSIAVSVNIPIKQDRNGEYWDTTVPFISCYEAGGFINHNTATGTYWSYLQSEVPNTNGLICANTIDQLNQSTMAKFFEDFPMLQRYYIKRDKMLLLPNGSKIFARSMEMPELIKGMNLHWAWADEIDGMSKYAWEILRSRTATTQGKILGTSSIYANSWITEYIKVNKSPDYEIITWPSKLNPCFPESEWKMLQNEMDPVDFAREYGGEFSFATGMVYSKIQDYGIISEVPKDSVPLATFIGLDFGINDPTAIEVMTYNSDNCWYIIDEYYKPGMSIQDINYWLGKFIEKYGRPYATVMDPAGGVARLSLIPECNSMDAVKKIDERIFLVRDLIYQKRVFCLKKCTDAVREFKSYKFDRTKINVPEDKNNHAMDAIGMVIHNCYEQVKGMRLKTEEQQLDRFWQSKKDQGLLDKFNNLNQRTEEWLEY